jgi:hypothetical protein
MQPQSSLLLSHPLLLIPKHVPRPWAQVVADLDAKFATAREGGGAKATERMCNKGKKFPHEEFCTVFSLSSGPEILLTAQLLRPTLYLCATR